MKSKNKEPKKKNKITVESIVNSWWLIIIMLIAIVTVFNKNYAQIFDRKIDLGGDNVVYYSLGQALYHGEGYTTTYTLEKAPHFHFPPGYPYFISKLFKFFPESVVTVKEANGFLLLCSLLLLFFIILISTKNSILAFCVCILSAMHKELLRYATIMMSETLFLFLSLAAILIALLLLKIDLKTKRKWIFWASLPFYGLLVAYIYFVRTMGLSLILSLSAWLLLLGLFKKQQRLKCLVLCAMTIIAVLVAKTSWDERNRNLGKTGSDYVATFYKKNNNEDMQGKEEWITRIKSNTSNFVTRWIPEVVYLKAPTMNPQSDEKVPITKREWVWGIVLLTLIIAGALYLNTGKLLMLLYMEFTVGILIFYPEQYGGTRYITPMIPIFIFLALNGLSFIVGGIFKVCKVSYSPLLAQSIVIIVGTFVFLTPKFAKAQADYQSAAKLKSWMGVPDTPPSNIDMKNFIMASRYCGDSLPDSARIICRKPELYYMFSQYHHSNGFPRYADPDTIYNKLCRDSIQYLIIDNWYRHAYVTLVPCVQKYPEKFQIVKQYGEEGEEGRNPTYILYFNDYWGYRGDLVDGVRQGQGELRLQDGRLYIGEFANGLPNGQGILYDSIGNVIADGIWVDGSTTISTPR